MKTFLCLALLSCSIQAQNFAVIHAKDSTEHAGMPPFWPVKKQPIGNAQQLPPQYPAPWVFATQAHVDEWLTTNAAAKEAWNQVAPTREPRKQRVGEVLQQRIEAGHWEPARLRLHALESELFGKLMQAFRLNSELLLLVTKAVGQSTLTNNLTAGERARVTALRPQLAFAQAPNLTQDDRDRVIFITSELQKVEDLWRQARALRQNIETNSTAVDPESLPAISIGE